MSRTQGLNWSSVVPALVAVALGGIGASAGFTHTHDWADAHGQHGWLAWADAVVIEGLAVVAGFELHRDHAAGRRGRAALLPQFVLVLAFIVQMTAQVAQAERSFAGWLLAAMPALGFLIVVKLLMRRLPSRAGVVSAVSAEELELSSELQLQRPVVEMPVTPAMTWLPVSVRETVATAAQRAHGQGRELTTADLRQLVSLPDPTLTDLVTELNTAVNNRRVSH